MLPFTIPGHYVHGRLLLGNRAEVFKTDLDYDMVLLFSISAFHSTPVQIRGMCVLLLVAWSNELWFLPVSTLHLCWIWSRHTKYPFRIQSSYRSCILLDTTIFKQGSPVISDDWLMASMDYVGFCEIVLLYCRSPPMSLVQHIFLFPGSLLWLFIEGDVVCYEDM